MSISDTRQAQRYASIAEVAAAECKLLTEDARKAPEYTDLARQYAEASEVASAASISAAQQSVSSANGASQSAVDAQGYANQASLSQQSAADSESAAASSESNAASSEANAAASAATAEAAVTNTLRIADGPVSPLANAATRANKVLSCDASGNFQFTVPSSGSAADVLNQIAEPTGAGLMGTSDGGTVQDFIDATPEFSLISAASHVGAEDEAGSLSNVQQELDARPTSSDLISTASGMGSGLSGWARGPITSWDNNVQSALNTQYVNVWEFASLVTSKPTPGDPNTWDWTPAIQGALNSVARGGNDPARNGGCIVFPPSKAGVYKVSQIEVPIGVSILGYGATISPVNQADTSTHLIKFLGNSKVSGLVVAMDYTTTYASGIWLRGRNNDFVQCAVWFASNAVTVGDPAWLNDPANGWLGDSENTFTSCAFNWCLKTVTAYGLNTGITFGGGCRVNTSRGSIPSGHPNAANWAAAPAGAMTSYGALIMLSGCQSGSYIRDIPLFTSRVMPTNTAGYVNSYGRLYASQVWMECSRIFYAPVETSVSADTITAALTLVNCFGDISPTQDAVPTITASSQLQQNILLSDCTFYHDPSGSSRVSNFLSTPGARVGLSNNALSCIGGEVRAACVYSKPISSSHLLLSSSFGSTQTLSTSALTLAMPSNNNIDLNDSARGVWYTNSSGVFTAAVDCYEVEVLVNLRYSTPTSTNTVTLNLVVSGTVVDSQVVSGGYPQKAMLNTRYLSAGQNMIVQAVAGGSYVLDGSSNTKITIRARTGQGRT